MSVDGFSHSDSPSLWDTVIFNSMRGKTAWKGPDRETRHESSRAPTSPHRNAEQCAPNRSSISRQISRATEPCGTRRGPDYHQDSLQSQPRCAKDRGREQTRDYRPFRLVTLVFILFGSSALGSPTPFVDGPFVTASADDDPDLIIVREKFNPLSRIQSIYLRFNDGSSDREILSGTLTIQGADVTTVLLDRQTLKETDLTWGIDGVNYTV